MRDILEERKKLIDELGMTNAPFSTATLTENSNGKQKWDVQLNYLKAKKTGDDE